MGGNRECTHCTMENVPSCVRHSVMGTRPRSRRPRPSWLHTHTHFGGYAGYIGYSFCNRFEMNALRERHPVPKVYPRWVHLSPARGRWDG